MTKLAEIQSAILRLPPLERAELRAWLLARVPAEIDVETDNPELETELLKVAEEPFTPWSRDEIHAVCTRVVREMRRP